MSGRASSTAEARAGSEASGAWNRHCWVLALALVWLWTWRHLATEWLLNEQYQFGFAIPVLAFYLAGQRLQAIRPDSLTAPESPLATFWLAVVAGWTAFLFGELLRELDPTWRLAGGMLNFAGTLLTAAACWRWGGSGLLRRMILPLAFLWLALPWPSALENGITLPLMRLVTTWTVSLLNAGGIAALQHGNVIELSNGAVGVDTACSGIQSFQSSLVAALFLGEFFAMRYGRRLTLVLGAWTIALLGNLARVYALTRFVRLEGEAAAEKHHDPVGLWTTIGTFAGILLLAWLLANRAKNALEPTSGGVRWLTARRVTGREGIALFVAVLAVPGFARLWYAVIPGEGLLSQKAPLWAIRTNSLPAGWRVETDKFTVAERNILRYSEGEALVIHPDRSGEVQLFHLFWKPALSVPSMAFSHSPDVCLPSAGWQQLGASEPLEITVQGAKVAGALFRFRSDREETVAFHALWYGGRPEPVAGHDTAIGERGGRLARLWSGSRRQGHELLTVFLPPAGDRDKEIRSLEELLATILQPN